ncbi:MAG: hypothetical protein AB7K24_18260 [Gemmataceae bacterium]
MIRTSTCLLGSLALCLVASPAWTQQDPKPFGTINLMSSDGVKEVKGEWRYADVTTGTGEKKNEIEPKAHGTFDDSKWEVLKPESLGQARGPGKYCWCWYRIKVTIPEKVGGKDTTGSAVWFRTTVDDYGEIWVDGKCDLAFGKSGRGAVSGFNTRNQVLVTKSAKPGDSFQIAVLGINSPLGNPPGNKIFLRNPTDLQFFEAGTPNLGANTPAVAPGPEGKAVASMDLMKPDDVKLLKGEWRYKDIEVHTGPAKNEIEPKAHGTYDDAKWEVLDPASLGKPRGPGKFSMAWYRIKITIPEKVGDVDVAGSEVWFRTTVDDYGEIWVNGKIDSSFGKSGRGAVSGFNSQNNVLLTKSAKPGEEIQIAVLGINSPFGNPPGNNIFLRKPTDIRFFKK